MLGPVSEVGVRTPFLQGRHSLLLRRVALYLTFYNSTGMSAPGVDRLRKYRNG